MEAWGLGRHASSPSSLLLAASLPLPEVSWVGGSASIAQQQQHAVPAALRSRLQGVNIPGHFFLTPAAEGTEFFVDAFEGGLANSSRAHHARKGVPAVRLGTASTFSRDRRLVLGDAREWHGTTMQPLALTALAGGDISFAQDVEATLTAIYRRPVKVFAQRSTAGS